MHLNSPFAKEKFLSTLIPFLLSKYKSDASGSYWLGTPSCPFWSWCCLYPDIPLGSMQPPGLSFTPDTSFCIRTEKGAWGLTDALYVGIQICVMCCLHCCLSPSGQGTETLARRCRRALCLSTCSPEIRDHLLRKLVQLWGEGLHCKRLQSLLGISKELNLSIASHWCFHDVISPWNYHPGLPSWELITFPM